MRERVDRIRKLRQYREDLNKYPQTVEREFEVAKLDMEIRVLDCETQLEVSRRALFFLSATDCYR